MIAAQIVSRAAHPKNVMPTSPERDVRRPLQAATLPLRRRRPLRRVRRGGCVDVDEVAGLLAAIFQGGQRA